MTIPDLSNGNGPKVPLLPVFLVLLSIVISGLGWWLNKVDERLFEVSTSAPSREEVQELRREINGRLDRIENQTARLVELLTEK